jgi:pSer/pThr/pTyr-binding forkhead associated (FHA) protein
MPRLVIATEDGEHSVTIGKEPITIGRSPANTIHISDPASSRKHCIIKPSGEVTTIIDMGSVNGTRVNGTRIAREQELRGGDVIQIGKTVLRFVDNES